MTGGATTWIHIISPSIKWTTFWLTGESRQLRISSLGRLNDFTSQELPQPVIDQELLNILDADAMGQDRNAELIRLLDLAMIPDEGETAVDDFVVELFKVLGYVHRQRLEWTCPFLFAVKRDMPRQMSVLLIALRMISFSLCRRTRGCSNWRRGLGL